jgi:general secretion pathway protein G
MIGYKIRTKEKGFTLIEILLVVIIIGILVSLVAPRLAGRSEEARLQAAKADIDGGMALGLDMYELDNGKFPTKLEDLVKKSSDSINWKGPYLKKGLSKDPWGSAYIYRYPGARHPEGYDLSSPGPDKQDATQDDIAN